MRISDWSSDVCSSDLGGAGGAAGRGGATETNGAGYGRQPVRTISLPGGETVPALGLGTWHMGERGADRAAEADALRCGIDLGMSLIDTAEMYASGVGRASCRERVCQYG